MIRPRRAALGPLLVVAVLGHIARAQPGPDIPPSGGTVESPPSATPPTPTTPSDALREGNTAATAGDWGAVSRLVDPLLRQQLPPTDLAEAHRLAGLAAYFQGRPAEAEEQFLAYLRLDLDGQLDATLYPTNVIIYFNELRAKYSAELRARRPRTKRYRVLTLVPVWGQIQNGERTKGIVIGGVLAGFAIGNLTSVLLVRRWCSSVTGDEGTSLVCDDAGDRAQTARSLRTVNLVTGVGLILTYGYSVFDAVRGYRRQTRERALQPFVTATQRGDGFIGVAGTF